MITLRYIILRKMREKRAQWHREVAARGGSAAKANEAALRITENMATFQIDR